MTTSRPAATEVDAADRTGVARAAAQAAPSKAPRRETAVR
jgi:hypothetical protein